MTSTSSADELAKKLSLKERPDGAAPVPPRCYSPSLRVKLLQTPEPGGDNSSPRSAAGAESPLWPGGVGRGVPLALLGTTGDTPWSGGEQQLLLKAVYDPPSLEAADGASWVANAEKDLGVGGEVGSGAGTTEAGGAPPETGVASACGCDAALDSPTKMRACLGSTGPDGAFATTSVHSSSGGSTLRLTDAAVVQPVLHDGIECGRIAKPEVQRGAAEASAASVAVRSASQHGNAEEPRCMDAAAAASLGMDDDGEEGEEEEEAEGRGLLAGGTYQPSDLGRGGPSTHGSPVAANAAAPVGKRAWFHTAPEPQDNSACSRTTADDSSGGTRAAQGAGAEGGNNTSRIGQLLTMPRVLVFLWQSMVMGLGLGTIGNFVFLHVEAMGGGETLMGLMLAVSHEQGKHRCHHVHRCCVTWQTSPAAVNQIYCILLCTCWA